MISLLAADEDLEVFAFCIGGEEVLSETQGTPGLHHVPVPADLAEARQTLASHDLDVLVYTDIGMDPLTYYLAFTRLAKTQCVMIGHLVTTGIPAMDYYLSSELIEPEHSEAHYSERLVKVKGMPCYIERPAPLKDLKSRNLLGLPEDRHLYLCPMRLNKVHPEFDAAVTSILRRDANGVVIFFRDREENDWHLLLSNRFAKTAPDLQERILFLPWAAGDDFRRVAAWSDVVLDTFYYGGGVTASIILEQGTPIVTWPGPFMRGRLTAGFYRRMGLDACIAKNQEEYVDIALSLATDRTFHDRMKRAILAANNVLYDNREIVGELSVLFQERFRR